MGIRISASTVAFPDLSLCELPARADALALDGLALTFGERGSMRPDVSQSDIREFEARCQDACLRISALYGYAGRGMLSGEAARAADLDLGKRCIDLAARLQAPVCRIFAWSGRPTPDLVDRFVAACLPLAEHAAGAGVVLGFPTHHDLAFDPESCRRLVSGFGRGRAGIIFNGPSMELDGFDPIAALQAMHDLVVQAELKDWRRDGAHEIPMPIGEGEAQVWPVVEALAAAQDAPMFDGWMTLHHLKQHHPELPDLRRTAAEAVRKAVARQNAACRPQPAEAAEPTCA